MIGSWLPKFRKDADLSEHMTPQMPTLKLCSMNAAGHIEIPKQEREKWLQDPIRSVLAWACASVWFPSEMLTGERD